MDFQDFNDDEELAALEKASADQKNMKGYLGALGAVADNFQSIPGSHELLWGGKGRAPTASKALGAVTAQMEDPLERKQKAFEYLKSKRANKLAVSSDAADSPDSLAMQEQIGSLFPALKGVVAGKSKTQIEQMMPLLTAKIKGDTDRETARIQANDRAATRKDTLDAKALERDEKRKASMNEVEGRRKNINDSLDMLDQMVKEKGTWEALGSHNQDLDRLVDTVATDMAKLQDPESVARPGEVEMVKRNLIASGFKNSNATAREIIKNFRNEVEKRTKNAYAVRGLEAPGDKREVKRQVNKKTGETRVVYSDGTMSIIPSTAGR